METEAPRGHLVLSCKVGENIVLSLPDGRLIYLCVIDVEGGHVRLGVQAPRDVRVDREEVHLRKQFEAT